MENVGSGGGVEDEDGVGSGVGGSIGGEEEATKCRMVSQKTSTILSIGSDRKASIAGSVHG